ncbi:MAG: ParB/RepB/Spo0J family partition protein [Acidaminococcales bacterium]|jgi:ParB family chromosome partitioning protein|nr:ParB/RepB/Spo0J family partition protein [Acidaminococcales bacterium]
MNDNKQNRLGKGLDALLPASSSSAPTLLETGKLRPNPRQPRKNFDSEKMRELASSIRQHGIIQPLIVRPVGDGYEIVAGERRWRAARELALETVPALVRNYTDAQIMQIALIENIQRHDLNPIEEAEAFKQLIEAGLTQEEIAQKIGRSRPAVANTLRLLNLPEKVREFVSRGTMNMGQARPLLALSDRKQQAAAAEKIVADGMSARAAESYINKLTQTAERATQPPPADIHTAEIEDRLALALGTQVRVKRQGGKGKILIDFYSDQDLERLLEIFSRPQPPAVVGKGGFAV